jgi:hypothetical protein
MRKPKHVRALSREVAKSTMSPTVHRRDADKQQESCTYRRMAMTCHRKALKVVRPVHNSREPDPGLEHFKGGSQRYLLCSWKRRPFASFLLPPRRVWPLAATPFTTTPRKFSLMGSKN